MFYFLFLSFFFFLFFYLFNLFYFFFFSFFNFFSFFSFFTFFTFFFLFNLFFLLKSFNMQQKVHLQVTINDYSMKWEEGELNWKDPILQINYKGGTKPSHDFAKLRTSNFLRITKGTFRENNPIHALEILLEENCHEYSYMIKFPTEDKQNEWFKQLSVYNTDDPIVC